MEIFYLLFWLIPTWFTAYGLRITAPAHCPTGDEHHKCKEMHWLHVKRQDPIYDAFLGLFWPVILMAGAFKLYTGSIEVAANKTPMTPMRKLDTSRMLEAADKHFEEMKEETDKKIEEIIKRPKIEDAPIEGKIVDY